MMMMWLQHQLKNSFDSNVLTCFLDTTGDFTGLMGETDSLAEGETDLRTTVM